MSTTQKRALRVFLCHASGDKLAAKDLYARLLIDGVDPWLDKEKLLPGQDWDFEIRKAVRESDAIIICLSQRSITKEGYVQKEIKMALDIADEKLEDTIYMIPARLEEVEVPSRLSRWQWVDLFDDEGYERLLKSLNLRAKKVDARIGELQIDSTTFENELQRLYSDGLEAYHTEKWERAIYYFQAFLAERPNSARTIEKLNISKQSRELEQLYQKALQAQDAENWREAIDALEDILVRSKDYKDVASRLEKVKRAQHLTELYGEAEMLYAAEAWQGVISVFKKIYKLEPKYVDPKNLFKQAQKHFETFEEQEKIAKLYAQALEKLDAQEFDVAKRLLKKVQRKSPGYRESEVLLEKVESKIERKTEKKPPINFPFPPTRLRWGALTGLALVLLYFVPVIWRNLQPEVPFVQVTAKKTSVTFYEKPNLRGDKIGVFLWSTAKYQVCMYDFSSQTYLVAHSAAGCDSDAGVFGWASASVLDIGHKTFWNLFPYIQY